MGYVCRLRRYAQLATTLALLSDERLQQHLDEAAILNSGIGGMTAWMELDETPIFVKIVPLTALDDDSAIRPDRAGDESILLGSHEAQPTDAVPRRAA